MAKNSSSSSINNYIVGAILASAVLTVVGIGIFSQFKNELTTAKPIQSSKGHSPETASMPIFDPKSAPAIDYTQFDTQVASSAASGSDSFSTKPLTTIAEEKIETPPQQDVKEKNKEPRNKIAQKTVVNTPKKDKKQPEATAVSVPVSAPIVASSPTVTPKPSDFSYVQPKAASMPQSSSSQPKDFSRNISIPKTQAFEPTVLEATAEKAWIKVNPTTTVIAETGKELGGYGKLIKIVNSDAIFEKGVIHGSEKANPIAK